MRNYRHILIMVMLLLGTCSIMAETPNEKQARNYFTRVYNMVYGKEGCSFSYSVNILGMYKATGSHWRKGRVYKYSEDRHDGWVDTLKYYKVDKKKKVVEVYRANDPGRTRFTSKIKFGLNDFNYHISNYSDKEFEISLNQKKGADGTIKHAKFIVDKKTLSPIKIKVKVIFFWITVDIQKFHHGINDDSIFVFP
nr:hypothetical protein [Bacteroidaceae bacterium]